MPVYQPSLGRKRIIRRDDYTQAIERFLADHNISTYEFKPRRKHRALVVEFGGRTHLVIFPFSGSDWRGPAQAVTTLRHVLGLVGTKVAS